MLWIDLETTGLEAQLDVPLELGLVLTDEWGHVENAQSWLIWESTKEFLDGLQRGHEREVVQEMHTKNGLWDALNSNKTFTREEAAESAVNWLANNNVPKFTLPMCGSSIGSLDRPFVQQHMPKLNEYFHYRNIDISSVKEICRRVNPKLYEAIRNSLPDTSEHRVIADCVASIEEYEAYVDNFFFI